MVGALAGAVLRIPFELRGERALKVIALDNSMLTQVAECSTEATLSRLGYAETRPNGAAEVGTLIHGAVADHVNGVNLTDVIEELQTDYLTAQSSSDWLFSETHVGFDSTHPDAKPQYNVANIVPIVRQWVLKHPQPEPFAGLVVPPEWVEVSFELPLDKLIIGGDEYLLVLTGQLDFIAREGDDLWVIDTKTTGGMQPWWMKKFESSTQLQTYQWAAEETTGYEVMGSYINAIETKLLPTSNKTCYKHWYSDLGDEAPRRNPRSKDHPMYQECRELHAESKVFKVEQNASRQSQWKRDVLSQARKFVELTKFVERGIKGATQTRTNGTFTDACIFCSYRDWCIRAGRDLRFADSLLGRNTQHRNVRVGVWNSEEEFFDGQANQPSVPTDL